MWVRRTWLIFCWLCFDHKTKKIKMKTFYRDFQFVRQFLMFLISVEKQVKKKLHKF